MTQPQWARKWGASSQIPPIWLCGNKFWHYLPTSNGCSIGIIQYKVWPSFIQNFGGSFEMHFNFFRALCTNSSEKFVVTFNSVFCSFNFAQWQLIFLSDWRLLLLSLIWLLAIELSAFNLQHYSLSEQYNLFEQLIACKDLIFLLYFFLWCPINRISLACLLAFHYQSGKFN